MARNSAAALRRLGGEPADFRSGPLTPELAADADLVLTMARDHPREVLQMAPRGLRRTSTLTEAAEPAVHEETAAVIAAALRPSTDVLLTSVRAYPAVVVRA